MKNARFWVFENGGWVKLTLRPDQSLSWYSYSRHEEGYSSIGITWTHEGSRILRESVTDGRDCDGRHGYSQEDACDLDLLASVPSYTDDHDHRGWLIHRPEWREASAAACYDEYAQVAGY